MELEGGWGFKISSFWKQLSSLVRSSLDDEVGALEATLENDNV